MLRITSKGQVTIPIEMREELGLLPGSEVEFRVEGDGVLVTKTPNGGGRGRALVSRMQGTATAGLTTEEIMALTRT